jgi:hypothetical protein
LSKNILGWSTGPSAAGSYNINLKTGEDFEEFVAVAQWL